MNNVITASVIFSLFSKESNIYKMVLGSKEVTEKVNVTFTVIPMTTQNMITHDEHIPLIESWFMRIQGEERYVDCLINNLYHLGINEVLLKVEA